MLSDTRSLQGNTAASKKKDVNEFDLYGLQKKY